MLSYILKIQQRYMEYMIVAKAKKPSGKKKGAGKDKGAKKKGKK